MGIILNCLVMALLCQGVVAESDIASQYAAQEIELPGVPNARQLGGYAIGARKVRMNVLLRTGTLAQATDQAVAALQEKYNLAFVADFRTSLERDAAPDRDVVGATNVALPVLEKMISGEEAASAMGALRRGKHDSSVVLEVLREPQLQAALGGIYDYIVFDKDHQRSFAAFLDRLVALPEGRAVLWHCSQGKDRCGWGSAFVLAALGADRSLTVADFALSNVPYAEEIEALASYARENGMEDELIDYIYLYKGVSVAFFEKTLDAIDFKYGSILNYMEQELDLSSDDRRILMDKFLE